MNEYELAREILKSSGVVAITGAGISTESGIPDFRGQNGIYNNFENLNPMQILSLSYFIYSTRNFYRYFYEKFNFKNVEANDGHKFLRNLEKAGMLNAIVTQNIDDLHEKAGSEKIYHTHGSAQTGHCRYCGRKYTIDEMKEKGNYPICSDPKCKGIIKTDVILYGERLNDDYFSAYKEIKNNCDTLLIMGTTLKTTDTIQLIENFKGKNIIVINEEEVENIPNLPGVNVIFLKGKIKEVIEKLNMNEYFIEDENKIKKQL